MSVLLHTYYIIILYYIICEINQDKRSRYNIIKAQHRSQI